MVSGRLTTQIPPAYKKEVMSVMNLPTQPELARQIATWLREQADVDAHRASTAAGELAECWKNGEIDCSTCRSVLNDHLTNDEPRPKNLADDLAASVGITLRN